MNEQRIAPHKAVEMGDTAHNNASDAILLCTYTGDDCHAKNGDRCMCDNPCKYRKTSHVA
jgi:hypothetical protein